MRTTAYHRDTPVALVSLRQGANSITLECCSRELPPVHVGGPLQAVRLPALTIDYESKLTQEQHNVLIQAFSILESLYAEEYARWLAEPQRSAELVVQAVEAEQRLAAAREEQRKLDAKIAEKRRLLTELEQQHPPPSGEGAQATPRAGSTSGS